MSKLELVIAGAIGLGCFGLGALVTHKHNLAVPLTGRYLTAIVEMSDTEFEKALEKTCLPAGLVSPVWTADELRLAKKACQWGYLNGAKDVVDKEQEDTGDKVE